MKPAVGRRSNGTAGLSAATAVGLIVIGLHVWADPPDLPRDVPARHRSAEAVRIVLQTGVMGAPAGRFDGSRRVSRAETVTVLARVARLLQAHRWPATRAVPLKAAVAPKDWRKRPVTRYDVAESIVRVVPYALAGLPTRAADRPFISKALPARPKVKLTDTPVHRELKYLIDRRMVWPGSKLLEPNKTPITGQQLADGLAQMIAGLNGIMTDEPKTEPILPRRN